MKKEQSQITQQAVLHLLRTENGGSSEARADFLAFARGSVANMRELLLAQATLTAFAGVDPQKAIDIESLPKLPELPPSLGAIDDLPEHRQRKPRLPWWGVGAAAAAVLAAFGWLLVTEVLQGAPQYTTGVGEQRTLKLTDGSTVILNTESRMKVIYSEHAREVRLLAGEALFQVEDDALRPFRVVAGNSVVRALGTQFNIYQEGATTRVSVVDGAVQVAPKDLQTNSILPVRLSAGDEAEVSRAGITRIAHPDIGRAIAWRTRQLMFDNRTLAEVAREFNRYNHIRLTIEGEDLRAVTVSGTFDADDVEPIVGFITRTLWLNAEVVRNKDEIVIRPR